MINRSNALGHRIEVFSDPTKPTTVHCYADEPSVYFIQVRGTNLHVATLAFKDNRNHSKPVTIEALLAICLHRIAQSTPTLQLTEARNHIVEAMKYLSGGEYNDD